MKKYFLTLILAVSLAGNVLADCIGFGMNVYPASGQIKQNTRIMIVGHINDEEVIRGLNKKYPIYLQTKGHKVALEVIETCQGMYSLTQAILKPAAKLKVGETYLLKIENQPYNRTKDHSITPLDGHKKVQWLITKGNDNGLPVWSKKPVFKKTYYQMFGCGPDMFVTFEVGIKDASGVLVKTQLLDATTNKTYTYYLLPDENGLLNVGHNMCSGAFNFEKQHKYKIRFSLVDTAGNTNKKWTAWEKCKNPDKG